MPSFRPSSRPSFRPSFSPSSLPSSRPSRSPSWRPLLCKRCAIFMTVSLCFSVCSSNFCKPR
ncbi:hypothetical protein E5C31_20245 [Providencia rettgeri]|nr:hypothetical protein [Providencia rettgeri]QHP74612.1 hypothetical protein EKQ45_00850 [Proteus vulgaris]